MTDRAQSELVGFMLVFAMVIAAMSLVTVAGVGELRDLRDAERHANAERAFDVFADNVDDLAFERATSRATELNLADARLSFGDPVTVTVNGTAVANASRNFSFAYAIRPLVYETNDGKRLVYAAGGTFGRDRSGTVMLSDPSLVLSPERSNVLVVQTRHVGDSVAVGGSSTVLVRTERVGTDLYRANETSYDLSIRVNSPRAAAWERYFDSRSGTSCTATGADTVTCSLRTERLYVSVVRVDVLLK